MTDFLDQLEHELRDAAQRRGRHRWPVRTLGTVAAAGAAVVLVAIGVSMVDPSRERSPAAAPVLRDVRIDIVADDSTAAVVASRILKRAGYTYRDAGSPDRSRSGEAERELTTAVLYRHGAQATAVDVARRLGLPEPRQARPGEAPELGISLVPAKVVVVLGPEEEQRVLAERGDCSPAGAVSGDGGLMLCEIFGDGASTTGLVVERDGERQVLPVERPVRRNGARGPVIGSWRWAAASPDGRTIVATWSGECETLEAFLIPAEGGRPRPVSRRGEHVPMSEALGWTTDGRAIVFMAADPGCGTELVPGLYLIAPDGEATLVAASDRRSPPAALAPSLHPLSQAEVRRAMRLARRGGGSDPLPPLR